MDNRRTDQQDRQDRLLGALARRLGLSREDLGVVAEAEARDALMARRRELVEQRTALHVAAAAADQERAKRKAETERRASKVRQVIEDAHRALGEIIAADWAADYEAAQYEPGRAVNLSRIAAELVETADPRIIEAVRDLRREEDELCRGGLVYSEVRNRYTDEVQTRSNAQALNARVAAIREAIRSAEALRLEALDADEVGERLRVLREGLPALDGVALAGDAWEPAGWTGVGALASGRAPAAPARPAPRGPRPEDMKPPKGGWWKPRRGRVA